MVYEFRLPVWGHVRGLHTGPVYRQFSSFAQTCSCVVERLLATHQETENKAPSPLFELFENSQVIDFACDFENLNCGDEIPPWHCPALIDQ
jgi:hypothetical protein